MDRPAKKSIITGVLGQDGIYLARLLLEKGGRVLGIDIHPENRTIEGIEYLCGSVADKGFLGKTIRAYGPDEIYNLASVSQVSTSFEMPEETFSINLFPVINMLELIRKDKKGIKFLQATSSEIFGGKSAPPYNENSALEPLSPYAVSKEAAYHLVKLYRKAYGIHAVNAILFNHTSARHGKNFIIPKIIDGLIKVRNGQLTKLKLGNLEIERDWGFAGDYVSALYMIMENTKPSDYVVGTGRHEKLREIVDYVLQKLGLKFEAAIEIDPDLFRPNDPRIIYSDPSLINQEIGWKAQISLSGLLDMMIKAAESGRTPDKDRD
jgi:GDPmannose 4,6-dehydratase